MANCLVCGWKLLKLNQHVLPSNSLTIQVVWADSMKIVVHPEWRLMQPNSFTTLITMLLTKETHFPITARYNPPPVLPRTLLCQDGVLFGQSGVPGSLRLLFIQAVILNWQVSAQGWSKQWGSTQNSWRHYRPLVYHKRLTWSDNNSQDGIRVY